MNKVTKIILLSVLALAIVILGVLAIKNMVASKPYCKMDKPFFCANQKFTNGDFYITFFNNGKTSVNIQDITISQKGKEKCYFLKSEIKDPEKDYYSTIFAGKGTVFLTSKIHPDGECLMQGMKEGEYYEFNIEITYFANGIKEVATGRGSAKYS
jgi:hypothetical protein